MEHLSELAAMLGQFLFWDKRRMTCFVLILTALFKDGEEVKKAA